MVLSRPQTRPQIEQAAKILGVRSVRFLEFQVGETQLDTPSKIKLVRLIRETRPDILITQDPEHSYADLDPDRRLLMLLYLGRPRWPDGTGASRSVAGLSAT